MNEMFPGFEKMKTMNVIAASRYLGVSRQAVYIAISKNKINANKINGKYAISERMLDEYRKNKYNRRISLKMKDNEFTVNDITKKTRIGKGTLYYMIRSGVIKSHRKGCAYIIKEKDFDEFIKFHPFTSTLA